MESNIYMPIYTCCEKTQGGDTVQLKMKLGLGLGWGWLRGTVGAQW